VAFHIGETTNGVLFLFTVQMADAEQLLLASRTTTDATVEKTSNTFGGHVKQHIELIVG
jgi:hypothetical protein